MKIFNTLTREKQELIPIKSGEYKIYVCGPTVYNYVHIGNARPLCVFDVLRRYLEYQGNKVIFVQNFTDIDDKLINRAIEEKTTVKELAEKYTGEYIKDARGLNVKEATYTPKATENVQQIIDLVKTLCDKGFAYEVNGDVYFRTNKFDEYGKLSHYKLEDLEAGVRIDVNDIKESSSDFALWKKAKQGEPSWESPWGEGRPGWHIECSAMAKRYLGDTIDIHCGGQDLIFPHHENEIAQSECANGVEFARYFMHNGYINVDNQKMSKSLGNFFTIREVAERWGYEVVRYLMVSSYYKSPINYTKDVLIQCQSSLERLYNFRNNLDFWIQNADGEDKTSLSDSINAYKTGFINAMDNDLNTADAISEVFSLIKEVNTNISENKVYSKADYEYIADVFDELINILGLLYNRKKSSLDSEVEELINQRSEARKNKDFKRADEIRDQLKSMGIVLEDTSQGVKWHRE